MLRHEFTVASLMMVVVTALAGPVHGQFAQVSDLHIRFDTTADDREGGVAKVEIWDTRAKRVVFTHSFNEKPEWRRQTPTEATPKINTALSLNDVAVRVTLTEAREKNISWTFHIKVELRAPGGGVLARFGKDHVKLDTTGKRYPGSDYKDLDRK